MGKLGTVTRRAFLKSATFAALAVNTLLTVGASSCTSVYNQISAWVTVGLDGLASVVNILQTAGIAIPDGGLIALAIKAAREALQLVRTAVDKYNVASADQKQSLLGEIATAIASAEGSIQNFWNTLALPDGQLASLIESLLGILTTTLAGFAASLPSVRAAAVAGGRRLAVLAVKRDKKKFAKDFNSFLVGTPYAKFAVKA